MSAECSICETRKNNSKFEIFPCEHLFCKRCLKEKFEKLLLDPSTVKSSFVCFEDGCSTVIEKKFIVSNIDEEFVKKYEKLKDHIEKTENAKTCSNCDQKKKRDKFIKLECKHSFCKRCLLAYFKERIKAKKFRFKCFKCRLSISTPFAQKILIEKEKYFEIFSNYLKSKNEEDQKKEDAKNSNQNFLSSKKSNISLKKTDDREKNSSSEKLGKNPNQPILERYKTPPFPIESKSSKNSKKQENEIQDQNEEAKKNSDDEILSENSDPFGSDIEGLVNTKNNPKPPNKQFDSVTPISEMPDIQKKEVLNCDIKCTQCETKNNFPKYQLSCEHFFCENCILIFLRVLIHKVANFSCKVCKIEMDTNKLPSHLLSMFDTFFNESTQQKARQQFEIGKNNEILQIACYKCKKKNDVKASYRFFICTDCKYKTFLFDNSKSNNILQRDFSAKKGHNEFFKKKENNFNPSKNDPKYDNQQKKKYPSKAAENNPTLNNGQKFVEKISVQAEDEWKMAGKKSLKNQRRFSNEKPEKKRNDFVIFQEKNFNPDFKSEKVSKVKQEEEKNENEAIFEVIPQSNQLRCRYCFEFIQYIEIEKAEKYHNKEKCLQKLKDKHLNDQLNSSLQNDSFYMKDDSKSIVCNFCHIEMPSDDIHIFIKTHGLQCKQFRDKSIHHKNNEVHQNVLFIDEHNNLQCTICKKCLKMKYIDIESTRHGIGLCEKNIQPEQSAKKKKKMRKEN